MSLGHNINVLQGMSDNLGFQVTRKMHETIFEFAPTVDHPKYHEYQTVLTAWQSMVERIQRQCDQIKAELNLCKPKAAHGPTPRHGGTVHNRIHNLTIGAIKSEEMKLQKVVNQVTKIKNDLVHLLYEKTDPIALANSLGGNAKDFIKQLTSIQGLSKGGGTTTHTEIRKYEPMNGPGSDPVSSIQDVTTVVALLIGLFLHWMKNK